MFYALSKNEWETCEKLVILFVIHLNVSFMAISPGVLWLRSMLFKVRKDLLFAMSIKCSSFFLRLFCFDLLLPFLIIKSRKKSRHFVFFLDSMQLYQLGYDCYTLCRNRSTSDCSSKDGKICCRGSEVIFIWYEVWFKMLKKNKNLFLTKKT